jgi:hypothetical protein
MKPGRFTWHFGANPEANRIINNNPVITEITDQKSGTQGKKKKKGLQKTKTKLHLKCINCTKTPYTCKG